MARLILRAFALCLALAGMAQADVTPLASLTARPLLGGATAPTALSVETSSVGASPVATSSSGSLFAGDGTGFFAPLPPRARAAPSVPRALGAQGPVAQLLSLIARVEAGSAGYDAVQHGARIHPPRAPTQMTLGEIHAWIAATPGQPHAIGRYQFIPQTLRRVAGLRGYGPETRFTPQVQDSLALILLEDAGLRAFEAGQMPRTRFMHNLARIWAGLPLPNGRSYYEGYAGNSAAMTWAEFEGGLARIWPNG
ncbi:hypothetical protein [Gymnodinialimonas sp.]